MNKLRNPRWAEAGIIEEFMSMIIQRCIDGGLVYRKHLAVDGSQVRANVSIQSFQPLELQESVEDYLERMALLGGEDQEVEDDSGQLLGEEKGQAKSEHSNRSEQGPANENRLELPGGGEKKPREKGNFHGEKLSNATHRSVTDPEVLLYRKGKGKETYLSYWMPLHCRGMRVVALVDHGKEFFGAGGGVADAG